MTGRQSSMHMEYKRKAHKINLQLKRVKKGQKWTRYYITAKRINTQRTCNSLNERSSKIPNNPKNGCWLKTGIGWGFQYLTLVGKINQAKKIRKK